MLNTLANKITLVRIVIIPFFLAAMYLGYTYAAFGLFIAAGITDAVDGYVARHYNQITDFGKFMDPLADKMLVLSALCFFIRSGQTEAWVVAVVLMREFAVSGLRLIAAGQGNVIAAAKSGKIKTAATIVCIGAMILFGSIGPVNIIGSAVILITTVWSGTEYFLLNYLVFFPGKERGRHENI